MPLTCTGCRDGASFDVPFSMAFQSIFDVRTNTVFAHEALVRGIHGESAQTILAQVDDINRYAFDQQCRVRAIEMSAERGAVLDGVSLSVNFMPQAVYEPRACIRLTLDAARRTGFPLHQIIFEFTETERLDTEHVLNILKTYREVGFKTAIDDFGAGYAGLNLLTRFQPNIVKIDMDLVRGIDTDPVKRAIVKNQRSRCSMISASCRSAKVLKPPLSWPQSRIWVCVLSRDIYLNVLSSPPMPLRARS